MKKKANILQNLLLVLLYVQSASYLDRNLMIASSFSIFVICLYFQGAKPYWPIFLLIILLQYFSLTNLQMIAIIIAAFLLNTIKLYEIPIPGKGQFNSGYKASKIGDINVCVFYPTKDIGKPRNWFPNKEYFKTLYEIFYVNPQTKRLPFFIFAFLVSFLTKVTMPCFQNANLSVEQKNKKKSFSLVIFSHGLGGNMNSYSSICGWLASHGYLVVSVQHVHDKIIVDHRNLPQDDAWKIRDYLYQNRNRDLKIRVTEVKSVLQTIVQDQFFSAIFNQPINIESIHLAGQSYGGGTVLETVAQLIKEKQDHLIKSIICLDPWIFPLSEDSYTIIKDKNILVINSQTFWESPAIPYIYELEKRFNKLRESNRSTLKAFLITKMNHLDQSDMAFVFGNIMQLFKKNSHYYLSQQILQLNLVLIAMFIEGKSTKQIMNFGNEFCKQTQLDKVGFEVLEEFRIERQIMLDFQKQRQATVQKLITNRQFLKRLFLN